MKKELNNSPAAVTDIFFPKNTFNFDTICCSGGYCFRGIAVLHQL